MSLPATTRKHARRSSSGFSFSTAPHSRPAVESPRTLCPKDTDAFSYDPVHLKDWCMPQEIWSALPCRLRMPLAALQHAGAAVLTGLDRLKEREEKLPSLIEHLDPLDSDEEEAMHDEHYEAVAVKLFNHQRKSSSGKSHIADDEPFYCSPVLPARSNPTSPRSNNSGTTTCTSSTSFSSPASSPLLPPSPMSPLTLSPRSPSASTSPPHRPNTPHFAHHHDAQTAQYLAELHHLRHEMLVRLRHAVRRVDAEWREVRRLAERAKEPEVPADAQRGFEVWWQGIKTAVHELALRGDALARGLDFSMGWGARDNRGWP